MKFSRCLLMLLCFICFLAGCSQSGYKQIVCEEYTKFEDVALFKDTNSDILHISIPKRWSCIKKYGGYDIKEFSKEIGSVEFVEGDIYETDGKQVFVETKQIQDISITHTINEINSNEQNEYTHTFIYEYQDSYDEIMSVILNINYEKVDENTAAKLMDEVTIDRLHAGNCMGIVPIYDNRGQILILGNSFIGSSQIHNTLQKMCGSAITVVAYGRGSADVGTYVNDQNVMSDIKGGNYSAVFMCGFYHEYSARYFEDIVDACKSSDTSLAIFPAHNEPRDVVYMACSKYDYPVFLDWQNEIDLFIRAGVRRSMLCANDYHGHSTPLAGYIGANMIYRALFGELPEENISYEFVSSNEISSLGDYQNTALIYASK